LVVDNISKEIPKQILRDIEKKAGKTLIDKLQERKYKPLFDLTVQKFNEFNKQAVEYDFFKAI